MWTCSLSCLMSTSGWSRRHYSISSTARSRQRFGQSRVKRRTRIVEVDFPEFDMSVDAVPARPAGIVWEIPDRSAGWVETNPEELGRLTHEMNGHHTLGTEGIYVPIVKLVRQIRREHFAKHPAGVYFEVLAYWAFQDMAACSSQAEYLSRALAGMTVTLRNALTSGMKDPSLPDSNLETKADAAQLAQTLSTLTSLSQHADMALAEEDECKSALEWRDLLGRNDDGLVFPMPAHCDEEGRRKFDFDVVAGSKRVPSGEGKFACLS